MVCFNVWNWCVDGVIYRLELVYRRLVYWLELVCGRYAILVGNGV